MPGAYGGQWGLKFGTGDICGRPIGGAPLGRLGQRGGGPGLTGEFPFRSAKGIASYQISGVSRDVQGNVLPLCTCLLFFTGTDVLAGKVVSEALTGAFAFSVPDKTTPYYIVFYLAGATDVAGTTVNTLVGS